MSMRLVLSVAQKVGRSGWDEHLVPGTHPNSRPESLDCASFRLCCLFFSALRRRRSFKRSEQTFRNVSDIINSIQERAFVRLGRFIEAADLSYELQRSGPDFVISDRRIKIEENFYISAHFCLPKILTTQRARIHQVPCLGKMTLPALRQTRCQAA